MQPPPFASSAQQCLTDKAIGSPGNHVPGGNPASSSVHCCRSQPFVAGYFGPESTSQPPLVENLSAQHDNQSQNTNLGVSSIEQNFNHA